MNRVAVLLADGFEEIEALTVVDVLRRADLQVTTLALKHKDVKGAHGVQVQADALLDEATGDWDLLVLPGGQPGADTLRDDPRVAKLLHKQVQQGRWLAAICAAPIALGKQGLLKGKKATCYPGFEGQLTGAQLSQDAVVVDGKIVTSRGPATALPFALELVTLLRDKESSDRLRQGMLVHA